MATGYDTGPRGPPRAGIGAHGQAPNLPSPINLGDPSNNSGANPTPGERYSLFVSGIPAMLEDRQLQEVMEVGGLFPCY